MSDKEERSIQRIRKIGTVAQTARRALKLGLLLRDVLNVERKVWSDGPLNTATVTTTTTFYNLNKIVQGLDFSDRTGRSIKALSLSMRGQFYFNVSATRSVLRLLVFIDTGHDGATPAIGDLLTGAPLCQSMLASDPNDRARYRVLYDKRWSFCAHQPIHFMEWKRTFKNHHILFDGTTAADYATGSIWIAAVSDEATNGPACELDSRITFVDN